MAAGMRAAGVACARVRACGAGGACCAAGDVFDGIDYFFGIDNFVVFEMIVSRICAHTGGYAGCACCHGSSRRFVRLGFVLLAAALLL